MAATPVAPVVPGVTAAVPVATVGVPTAGVPLAAPVLPTAATPVAAPVLPGAVTPAAVAPAAVTPAAAVPVPVVPGATAPAPAVPLVDDALGGVVAGPVAPAPAIDPDAPATGVDASGDPDFDGDVTSVDGATAAASSGSPAASNGVPRDRLPQLSQANLTAADGFIYDFKVTDEDYIPPNAPLRYQNVDLRNMTLLPPVPATAQLTPPEQPARLLTWRQDILDHNKELWQRKANRKIDDAVTTLIEQADIYMRDPVYVATNKTVVAPASGNVTDADPSRIYFSLSDYYWPHRVSSVNPNGLPYKYNPSVNLQVPPLLPPFVTKLMSSVCSFSSGFARRCDISIYCEISYCQCVRLYLCWRLVPGGCTSVLCSLNTPCGLRHQRVVYWVRGPSPAASWWEQLPCTVVSCAGAECAEAPCHQPHSAAGQLRADSWHALHCIRGCVYDAP